MAFYFALALVFVRFSLFQDVVIYRLGFNIYPLYIFGIPTILGILVTGGFRRALRYRPAKYWLAFGAWLIPTAVWSIWRGGSFNVANDYFRTNLILLFAIAGLAVTWDECKLVLYTLAASAVASLAFVMQFGERDQSGRMHLSFGAIANSNDYACHLLILLPFLLWVILFSKSWLQLLVVFPVFAFGLYQVLASASRGALLGTIAGMLVYLSAASKRQRRIALIMAPLILFGALYVLPGATVNRIFTFTGSSGEDSDAVQSSRERQQLFVNSIWTTIHHPLMGVGPGQFGFSEAQRGLHSAGAVRWFQTHNTFTQVSSESGLPGLLFFIAGIASSLMLLNRLAREHRQNLEFLKTALCMRIALAAFCVAIFFLSFAYTSYLPAISGLIIAMACALETAKPVSGRADIHAGPKIATRHHFVPAGWPTRQSWESRHRR